MNDGKQISILMVNGFLKAGKFFKAREESEKSGVPMPLGLLKLCGDQIMASAEDSMEDAEYLNLLSEARQLYEILKDSEKLDECGDKLSPNPEVNDTNMVIKLISEARKAYTASGNKEKLLICGDSLMRLFLNSAGNNETEEAMVLLRETMHAYTSAENSGKLVILGDECIKMDLHEEALDIYTVSQQFSVFV